MDKTQAIIRQMQLSVISMEIVPDSYSSTVHLLTMEKGEKAILKIPYNRLKLVREYSTLQRLQGHLPVPKILEYWEGDEEHVGAILLSYLPGEPLQGQISPQIARQMGHLLGKLHQIPI
jgi:Ser/Thr protein kinase RdoA (MazF antagonist)